MLRRAVCVVAVFAVSVGIVMAEDIRCVITKVSEDGKTITCATRDKETKKLGEGKDYAVSSSVKVNKGKYNREEKKLEVGDTLKDGLSNEMFKSIGKRGVFATITTDDSGNVTQIVVSQGRGKGGKRKKTTE